MLVLTQVYEGRLDRDFLSEEKGELKISPNIHRDFRPFPIRAKVAREKACAFGKQFLLWQTLLRRRYAATSDRKHFQAVGERNPGILFRACFESDVMLVEQAST